MRSDEKKGLNGWLWYSEMFPVWHRDGNGNSFLLSVLWLRQKVKKPTSEWRKCGTSSLYFFFDILRRHKNLEHFLEEFSSRHCRPKLSISCALWAGSNVEGISRRSHKMLTASTGAPLTGELMIVQDDLTGNLAPRWLIALEARSADWSSVWMWMTFHRWMLCSRALRWMTQDQ